MDALRDRNGSAKHDIAIVRIGDEGYPPLLREIHDPPQRLYVRGDPAALIHPLPLAVVGTRKMTNYGATVVRILVGPIAGTEACIVSGLALGVDAAAHAAALDAGGATVAVLAGGVDRASVGPRTNAALAERIVASGGALVSERPPGSSPSKMAFPRRNRIIAGIARGTLVVEAAAKSGSLITAYLALEGGRDVFAVPGPITSATSAGANGLIRRGAVPVTSANDVLAAYGLSLRSASNADDRLDGRERTIAIALEKGPMTLDTIIAETGLEMRDALTALTSLTLQERVADQGGFFTKN